MPWDLGGVLPASFLKTEYFSTVHGHNFTEHAPAYNMSNQKYSVTVSRQNETWAYDG